MPVPPLRLWCRPSIIRQPFRRWQSITRLLDIFLPHRPSETPIPSRSPIRRVPCRPPIQKKASLPRLNPNPNLQGRTFQLLEFHNPFGAADTHYFLFIQRYRNSFALTTLQDNLRRAFATGEVASYLYTYTDVKLEELEKSCLLILKGLGVSKDAARYNVVIGKIGVEPRGPEEEEAEWFRRTFGSARDPDWGRLRGEVIDFEERRSVPDEKMADRRSLAHSEGRLGT